MLANPAVRQRGVVASGRASGDRDACTDAGIVIDLALLDRIVAIDRERGSVTVQAGVTWLQLLRELARHRLTLPVVPDCPGVTVGDAIARDAIATNHPRDGSLARHVRSLTVCTPSGGLSELSAQSEPELFHAMFGGLGVLGIIVAATLQTEPLQSRWISLDIDRSEHLEATLALMASDDYRYAVAWLDLLADDPSVGRAIVKRANWSNKPRDDSQRPPPPAAPRRWTPEAALRSQRAPHCWSDLRLTNAVIWHATPQHQHGRQITPADQFFGHHGPWVYNPPARQCGRTRYRFAVPPGQETAVLRAAELLRNHRLAPSLALLKRLGPPAGGPLSFAIDGWSVAIDLPTTAGLRAGLDALNQLVAAHAGRVCLTSSVRLGADLLAAMYPQLDAFRRQRAMLDPHSMLEPALARRLGLGQQTSRQ